MLIQAHGADAEFRRTPLLLHATAANFSRWCICLNFNDGDKRTFVKKWMTYGE
jgi:hypothetical protein